MANSTLTDKQKKKQFLFISGSDLGQPDGPVFHFCSLLQAMTQLGVKFQAYAPIRRGKPPSLSTPIHVVPCTAIPILSSFIYQMKLFWVLVRVCLLEKPDLLYIRSHYLMISPLLINFFFKVPFLVEFNGIIDDFKNKRLGMILLMGKIIESSLARKSKAVISVTEKLKTWLSDHYKLPLSKIYVISNAADPERFSNEPQLKLKKKLNLELDTKTIVYVGTLSWWQGVSVLIEAAQILKKKMDRFQIIITGNGPERSNLETQVKERKLSPWVDFRGTVSFEEAALYMGAGDVCVVPKLPIRSGYSPLKLYEYMAAGKPVIASDLPGFEIILEAQCGKLFPSGNPEALAETLEDLLSFPEKERYQMGQRGREKIIKDHDWKHVAQKTLNIMHEML